MRTAIFLGFLLIGVAAWPASASVQVDSSSIDLRAAKPKVVCAQYRAQRFFVRPRPANCDFPDPGVRAGSIGSWDVFPTRKMRWPHWGLKAALGRGKAFMRGVGWRPVRVKLTRPRTTCGRKVFTRLQVRMNAPGRGWMPWGRRYPVKACVK